MALQRTKLTNIVYPTTGTGTIYTNTNGESTYLKGFLAYNNQGSSTSFSLFLLETNLTNPVNTNKLFSYSISSDETTIIDFPYSLVLTGTNSIACYSSTTSGINMILFGDKE
jgi:hypothetical protein